MLRILVALQWGVLLGALALFSAPAGAQLASSPWPRFRHDVAGRAQSPYNPSASINGVVSVVGTGALTTDYGTSPSIGAANEIYVSVQAGYGPASLESYHITGTPPTLTLDKSVQIPSNYGGIKTSSPAIDNQGNVYLTTGLGGTGASYGYLVKIAGSSVTGVIALSNNPSNSTIGAVGDSNSPNIGPDGNVYTGGSAPGSGSSFVFGAFGINPTTMTLLPNWPYGSIWDVGSFPGWFIDPALDAVSGKLYYCGYIDNYARAYRGGNGNEPIGVCLTSGANAVYDQDLSNQGFQTYASRQTVLSNDNSAVYAVRVDATGTTGPPNYLTTYMCSVESRNTSGGLNWDQPIGTLNDNRREVAVDSAGNVIVGGDGYVYKFTSAGQPASGWPVYLGGDITAAEPTVDSANNVYVTAYDSTTSTGSVYILAPDGTVLKQIPNVNAKYSTISLGSDFAVVNTDQGLALLE